MTAALEGGEWSAARPGRTLPPGKTRHPFYRRLGGPQGRSGRAENLVPTGNRSRTVQPVVSRYTDWATQPTFSFSLLPYFVLKYIGLLNTELHNTQGVFDGNKQLTVNIHYSRNLCNVEYSSFWNWYALQIWTVILAIVTDLMSVCEDHRSVTFFARQIICIATVR
jgi:hypothetical protein